METSHQNSTSSILLCKIFPTSTTTTGYFSNSKAAKTLTKSVQIQGNVINNSENPISKVDLLTSPNNSKDLESNQISSDGKVNTKTVCQINPSLQTTSVGNPHQLHFLLLSTVENRAKIVSVDRVSNSTNQSQNTDLPPRKERILYFNEQNEDKDKREIGNTNEPISTVQNMTTTISKTYEPENNFNNEPISNQNKVKELFCRFCNVTFSTVELLQEHKDMVWFSCRLCLKEFDKHLDLETHFVTHKSFRCTTCKERFYGRRDLMQHIKLSNSCDNRVECEICHEKFVRKTLKYHKLSKHLIGDENSHTCVVCGKGFKHEKVMNQHQSAMHTAYEYQQCNICEKICVSHVKLTGHFNMSHYKSQTSDLFNCTDCEKVFTTQYHLIKHREINHNNNIELLCKFCGMSFKRSSILYSHLRYKHPKKGIYPCKKCNKPFETYVEMRKHHVSTHKLLKPSVFCEICGKNYKDKAILKVHLRVHSSEKPHMCKICGASFKTSTVLKTHGRTHTNIGKYLCDGCNMTFKWKNTYDRHLTKCEALTENC